ncbi:MAG TPA: hypothetical protein VLM42_05005 [Bryobacteraceae bacterium]|nr:hypothetical protein [Bryobacteraceae bacterium]
MSVKLQFAAVLITATVAFSQGHPDLSGTWTFGIDLPPGDLVKVVDGKVTRTHWDGSTRHRVNEIPGALPWEKAPSYKPEFQEKVKFNAANESKVDPVFYCDKPGTPRIGSPRKIIQLPTETIFLYEDISGDTFRIIPTDGRGHRAKANPSAYGDSIGHWEKDVFVVESTNFVDDTWFGEEGYLHSDKMRVIERLWLTPEHNLAYQATVEDPAVLTKPWTNFARVIPPNNDPIEESPTCKEDDGKRLLNLDHHLQR